VSRLLDAARYILWGMLAWLVAAAVLAGLFYPVVPHSRTGWLLFIGLSPPLYLLSMILANRIWSSHLWNRFSYEISSGLRIGIGVLVGCIGIVFACWASWLFTRL